MENDVLRLGDDTIAYVDTERHKLIIEIDLPAESTVQPEACADALCRARLMN